MTRFVSTKTLVRAHQFYRQKEPPSFFFCGKSAWVSKSQPIKFKVYSFLISDRHIFLFLIAFSACPCVCVCVSVCVWVFSISRFRLTGYPDFVWFIRSDTDCMVRVVLMKPALRKRFDWHSQISIPDFFFFLIPRVHWEDFDNVIDQNEVEVFVPYL